MPDRIAVRDDSDDEEILQYNVNLFLEALDMIDVANILLSLKNDV
jgi:hypothetical protein